jgi:hypothetical protein
MECRGFSQEGYIGHFHQVRKPLSKIKREQQQVWIQPQFPIVPRMIAHETHVSNQSCASDSTGCNYHDLPCDTRIPVPSDYF